MPALKFRRSRALLSASLIAIGAIMAPCAAAQILSGTVTDASGTAPFEGAVILIEDTGRQTSTNRFGEYRFVNIAPGSYTLITSYVGTDRVRSTITVPEAGAVLDITLGDDVAYADNIIVVGTRAAQAGAINQQRAANSILTVIDSDGLGSFPDTTVADSLSRAVGVSIETDQGEGRYVSIRGINTDLISASINGVRTPSPEDRRGVLLDGVPSDLLSGIEIQKSLTPDVDGDSLGGVINLKTISAFDRDDQFIRANVEGRYNEITKNISPKGTLTYSNVFADKLGVALSATYQNLVIESHNNEAGGWGVEDGDFFFLNDDYEQRFYDLTRERIGFVGNFDLDLSDTTRLYLRTLFNNYEDDEIRNKFEYRDLDDGAALSANVSSVPINEVDAEVRQRREIRQIQTYALGGETDFEAWTFDYEVAYAFAKQDDSDNHDVTFRFEDIQDAGVGNLLFDTSDPQQPLLSGQVALDAIFDPSNYSLDELEEEDSLNEDKEYSARIDIAREALLGAGAVPVTWKFGGKYRDREKTRDVNKIFSEADDLGLSAFVGEQFIDNWRLANPMPAFPDADLTATLRDGGNPALDVNQDATALESLVEDFDISEKILAGYLMGTFTVDKATIVAGARIENTALDLTGFAAIDGVDGSVIRNFSQDYTDILPSVNLKYDFNDQWIGRAAYYKAVVRPAFNEIAPSALIEPDETDAEDNSGNDFIVQREIEIFAGNPNLDPLDAHNFDIALEFYPTQLSLFSAGVFYKSINNAIFGQQFERQETESVATFLNRIPVDLGFIDPALFADIDPASVPAELRGEVEVSAIDVDTFVNVSNAEIFGFEFNYVQDLSELAKALDGFILSGNLTLTDSEATLPDGRVVPFLKQSNTVGNIALAYDKGPWDLRVSANYRGDFLDELVEADLDRFTDDRLLIEASAKYKFNDNFLVYLEGKNLTDAPEYYYFGDSSRLSQYDEFGRAFIIGARFTY